MKLGLVIPWREQPSRIKPLEAVLDWYKTNLIDIEVFYSDRPGEYWNAAASRNDGVKRAQEAHCDVIIINDADTLPEIEPLLKAIEECQKDNMIHNPYRLCKYFDKDMTDKIFQGADIKLVKHKLYTEANGGIYVCTPEAWWSVGGMDEKFIQWGGEDSAFELAHSIIKGRKIVKHDGYIYCLGHDQQIYDPGFNFNHLRNIELYWLYYSASTPERMLALVKQKTKDN
jgi:predicted glycosyltransferase involved in capsule biosynthesis